jgi:hypothetical protein
MNTESSFELAPLFQAVGQALQQNRAALNQADAHNGNHGDHMVQVFELAALAAEQKRDAGLSEAMEYAADLLQAQAQNGSAQAYARGLSQMARQFRSYGVSLDDLILYVRGALAKDKGTAQDAQQTKSGSVLKALVAGLAAWGKLESGQDIKESPLDMGALFEFGMAYIQAKGRGGDRIEVLSDAAASVTPLVEVPHRYESGKLAIQALLRAMQGNLPSIE